MRWFTAVVAAAAAAASVRHRTPVTRGVLHTNSNTCYCHFFVESTSVILDPKGGDAGSVSPGVEKSLRTVQRGRDYLTTSTRLAIDLTTARKSRKRLGKN